MAKNSEIVTRWPKAPNLAHIYFRPKQNFLEGVPHFKGQGLGQGQLSNFANWSSFSISKINFNI